MQQIPEQQSVSSAAPPVVGESVVEFVRAQRQPTAYILMAVSAVLLAIGGWAAYKANKTAPVEEKPKTEMPFELEESEVKVREPGRNEYFMGGFLAGLGVLIFLGIGAFLLVNPPRDEVASQRSEARAVILAAGGLFGALVILAGATFFYFWSSSLLDWLDKGQQKQAIYAIAPLMAVAVGAAIMFIAMLPARAEERNNLLLRRLIYGSNFGLGVLLLFVALVVLNLVLAPRLPSRLDTTSEGFYSLSDASRDFLGNLPEPVTAYAILQDNRRDANDIRRLLANCQDASGGRFTVKSISAISDTTERQSLAGRYPILETSGLGVLLTVGADEKRHVFIREDEFVQVDRRSPDATGAFVGESRLLRELLFLLENSQKAVVYFTQSAGELDISEGAQGEQSTARMLAEFLRRNNLEVKPLKFEPNQPAKVPDDAAVVIVAEPEQPLADAHVAALRAYMMEPRPGGKKGKLIVLAGVSFGPKREVLRTGLEELLQDFGVRIDQRLLIGASTRELPPLFVVAGFAEDARRAQNPVAMALGTKAQFLSPYWRVVAPAQASPEYRVVPLLYTLPRGRFTWLESTVPHERQMNQIINELNNNVAVRREKQFSDDLRAVGVAVSEGDAGRIVVVGNGIFVSDDAAQQAGVEPLSFDLVSGSIDWLRDRPPLSVDIQSKQYVMYRFPATTDETRGLWLPLIFGMTIVIGLGASVWLVRRRAS